jgi:hypothetical protein
MFRAIHEKLRRARDDAPRFRKLELTPTGARVVSTKSSNLIWQVEWAALEEIVAYKLDAYVVDHLCLGLRETGGQTFHVVDEETPGWNVLQGELKHRFGVDFSEWFARVAFPPFAENWTVLWKRS